MRYVEALAEYQPDGTPALFLAGGITGCPGWQQEVVERLTDQRLTILNPRRANFPIDDPSAAFGQIDWEHRHLRLADGVLFWFPKETLCPITLYELGACSMTRKPLFVGVEEGYLRQLDVAAQTKLARPDVTIVHSLDELAGQVKGWLSSRAGSESAGTDR